MSRSDDIADFAADGTFEKIDPRSRGRITPAFNAALFAFVAVKGLFVFLLTPSAMGRPPISFIRLDQLLFNSAADLIRIGVLVLIAAIFLNEFWRRLVSPLGSLRPIDYNESIAILLMAAVVFGG